MKEMYLYLGQNEVIPYSSVIGIFDLDKCSYGKRTRDYLTAAEKEGVVLDISGDLPRSFVVCDHPYHDQIIYLSQFSPAVLRDRSYGVPAGTQRSGSSGERRKERS